MAKRPNFLFLMTDQQRADWLGCAGHPVVKTPHIDALANVGTRFDQFFVAMPVCMPNRASLMTGRYPSVHGLRYNGCLLPERAHTFVDVLRQSGYRTASIGKSHLQPFSDINPVDRKELSSRPIEEAWRKEDVDYTKEEPIQYKDEGHFDFPTPYYGFDHVDMVTRHGDKAGGHYQQWFRKKHPDWKELADKDNELPHNYTCPQAYRTPVPEDSYSTAYIRDRAVDYVNEHAGKADPFFAFVSFPDPHHPFNPPGRYWDMYHPDQFDVETHESDHKNPPPPLVYAREEFEAGRLPKVLQSAFMATDQHLKEAMALSAGMVTMIDDAVGAIIDALKESGQYENTVIIYNADHGDYMGDCNLLLKGAWPRDSINKVPMIWSDPSSRSPRVSSAMASTIDLSATILDRAGIAPYFGIQGESFVESITSESPHRDRLLIEFNDSSPRLGFDEAARVRTIVTEDWQLSVYGDNDWGELYDRINDPSCLHNLWDDESHKNTKTNLIEGLTHLLIAQMDESPRSTRQA